MSRDDTAQWLAGIALVECCDITTIGRRTGRPHTVEIWFGVVGDELCLISGNGPTADWYRNLLVEPRVDVRIDSVMVAGHARPVVDPAERRFELADYVRVQGAELEDGLLVIDLIREVPEAMKPKKITIGGAAPLTIVDGGEASEAA